MNNLERLIAHLDPQSARFATAALDWLLPQGGDLDDLTQIELQDFLWLQLPAVWPVPIELQLQVAEALAELFTLSGHRRLAEVCRSPRTRAVFGAWAEGLGLTAYRQAMEASGVEPPNTGRITWSHVMGAGEGEVRREIGRLLEARIDQDAVRAGSWEWRAYAAELTDEFLVTPHERWPGRLPLQVVEEARLRLWLLHGSPGRRVLLQPVVPQLTREAEPSPEALAMLEPLRWLLERLRAGLVLTKTGRLPLSVVTPAAALFGWTRDRPPAPSRRCRGCPRPSRCCEPPASSGSSTVARTPPRSETGRSGSRPCCGGWRWERSSAGRGSTPPWPNWLPLCCSGTPSRC